MPDFRSCIAEAAAAGDIAPDVAAEAAETYEAALAAAAGALGPADADRAAAKAVMDALELEAAEGRRRRVLAIRNRRGNLEDLADFKTRRGYADVQALGGSGGKPPGDGWVQGGSPPPGGPYRAGKAAADFLIELIDGQGGLAGKRGASVKGRYQAIRGSLDAMMAEAIERFESKWGFDTPGRATLANVVREAFGQDTGDPVSKALAEAWAATAERARQMFNAAGGAIQKLEGWGLPQTHDPVGILRAGKDAWVDFTLPLLDRTKMTDRATGAPFTEKRLRAVLGDVWNSIVTQDAANRAPGEHLGLGMLAKRRAEHRFLAFRDPDAWTAYQTRFGRSDPYAAMVNHLDGMARDIARMQVLGPNPDHELEWLARFAEREARIEEAAGAPGALGKARHAIDTARKMYGLFTGELATPYARQNLFAAVAAPVRAFLAGAQLGSAVINDVVSNPVFAAQARALTGLSRSGDFRALAAWMASPEARRTARRTGFILEATRARLAGSAQDMLRAETVGQKAVQGLNWFARRLPVAVYRASLMTPHLSAERFAFQHEFMGALYDRRGRTLGELLGSADAEDRLFGETLAARGITEEDWAKIRATDPEEPVAGARFISPEAVRRAHGDELAFALAEAIERQTRLAVPEPSLWAQAQLYGGSRPGTFAGEFWRSLGTYRSFTVTQTYLWTREFMARAAATDAQGQVNWRLMLAGRAAALATTLTVAGALGLQIREVAKGNDPRPMGDPKFWTAAILYGGGLGIFGDFLYSATARNGKGSSLTALGAPASLVSDLWDATGGAAGEVMFPRRHGLSLEERIARVHEGRRLALLAARYSPLSSIWWARAAWDRMAADQLQRMLDPDADQAFRAQARRLQQETGQTQWWPEGGTAPSRAPDVGVALQAAH